jgi:hypothetical protein
VAAQGREAGYVVCFDGLDDDEIEEGLREPYGSWDPPKPWPDDEDARLTEQESQGKGSGRGEEDCEEQGDDTDEGEETSEEEEEDSEGEATIYINVRRFTRSPTPENDVGCSPQTKHLRSRRHKEMRELKAMSLAQRPPRPKPTLEEQQAERVRLYGSHPVDVWFERELQKSRLPAGNNLDYSWISGASLVSMLDEDRVMVTTSIREHKVSRLVINICESCQSY